MDVAFRGPFDVLVNLRPKGKLEALTVIRMSSRFEDWRWRRKRTRYVGRCQRWNRTSARVDPRGCPRG